MSEEHYAARDRVNIGKFYKDGYTDHAPIRGVVHVGANDGYEVEWYQKLGIEYIMCFEPGRAAQKRFIAKYGPGDLLPFALGNINGIANLHVAPDDGGSTFLPEPSAVAEERTVIQRWTDIKVLREQYNCCVIDVQGMELDVLRGMDERIQDFDYFNIECSATPCYPGEAYAEEVVRYMERMGFVSITPICPHDDILFVKETIWLNGKPELVPAKLTEIPAGTKLNCGSGQRPFARDDGWINVDSQDKWTPELVADIRNLSMFEDGSMEIVALHHVLEHFGCGEADGVIRESHRVLKPHGSLIVCVPDPVMLYEAWRDGRISEQIYMTNLFGAYMGDEADRHRWMYSRQGLVDYLGRVCDWSAIRDFDWRSIPGADIARDFWIIGIEAIK